MSLPFKNHETFEVGHQKEKTNNSIQSKEFFIPDIKLVGYGRSQTYQIVCLKCKDLFFSFEKTNQIDDLFCDKCLPNEIYLIENNYSSQKYIGNIIGWEVKSASIFKRRSHYNYKKVYKRDEYKCQYCDYSLRTATEFRPLHIDHILPWSASGSNKMDNLCVACAKCNLHASDKWFYSFNEKKQYILEKTKNK